MPFSTQVVNASLATMSQQMNAGSHGRTWLDPYWKPSGEDWRFHRYNGSPEAAARRARPIMTLNESEGSFAGESMYLNRLFQSVSASQGWLGLPQITPWFDDDALGRQPTLACSINGEKVFLPDVIDNVRSELGAAMLSWPLWFPRHSVTPTPPGDMRLRHMECLFAASCMPHQQVFDEDLDVVKITDSREVSPFYTTRATTVPRSWKFTWRFHPDDGPDFEITEEVQGHVTFAAIDTNLQFLCGDPENTQYALVSHLSFDETTKFNAAIGGTGLSVPTVDEMNGTVRIRADVPHDEYADAEAMWNGGSGDVLAEGNYYLGTGDIIARDDEPKHRAATAGSADDFFRAAIENGRMALRIQNDIEGSADVNEPFVTPDPYEAPSDIWVRTILWMLNPCCVMPHKDSYTWIEGLA